MEPRTVSNAPGGPVRTDVQGRNNTDEDVLTVNEAAAYLRIGRNQLYDAIGRGEIPHLRIGRTIRLSRRVLDRVLGGAS